MSVTVNLAENRAVSITEEVVEAEPSDTITFAVAGTVTMTEAVLEPFEGARLDPTRISVSVDGSRTVPIDLSNGASLALETVDVGVETPDADGMVPDADSIPGAIAFTVEGVIRDVPERTFESVAGGDLAFEAITFAVEGAARSDGGSGEDVVYAFRLLGFEIRVHRNGTVDVGTRGNPVGLDLP